MGCLSERYKEQLTSEIPEVDGFYGVNELASVVRASRWPVPEGTAGRTAPHHPETLCLPEDRRRVRPKVLLLRHPRIRGKHISRPVEEMSGRGGNTCRTGVKELLGDLAGYHLVWA